MDALTKAERSALMARITGDGLGPERAMAAAIRAAGARGFVRNDRSLPGSPDFAFHAARLAVFVHGCFWHGCPRHYRAPRTRRRFWSAKLAANRRRDARVRRALNRLGWSVMVVWEHSLRNGGSATAAARVAARLCNAG